MAFPIGADEKSSLLGHARLTSELIEILEIPKTLNRDQAILWTNRQLQSARFSSGGNQSGLVIGFRPKDGLCTYKAGFGFSSAHGEGLEELIEDRVCELLRSSEANASAVRELLQSIDSPVPDLSLLRTTQRQLASESEGLGSPLDSTTEIIFGVLIVFVFLAAFLRARIAWPRELPAPLAWAGVDVPVFVSAGKSLGIFSRAVIGVWRRVKHPAGLLLFPNGSHAFLEGKEKYSVLENSLLMRLCARVETLMSETSVSRVINFLSREVSSNARGDILEE